MIEPSKFSTDKMFKPYREEERRPSEKGDYKSKVKSDHHLKRNDSRPPIDYQEPFSGSESNNFSNKNYIPKPSRAGSGYDSSGVNDTSKYKNQADSKVFIIRNRLICRINKRQRPILREKVSRTEATVSMRLTNFIDK